MTEHVRLDDLEARPGAMALDGQPRVVRLALEAGESVPPHDHPGTTVVVFVVAGAIEVVLDGAVHSLGTDELLRFDGELEVAIDAVEDARALVTLVQD